MISKTIAEITKSVKIAIDENDSAGSNSILVADPDQLQLDELIRYKIVDAVRYIHQVAPSHMLDGIALTTSATATQSGKTTISLPSDFMRLVIFKMSGWTRPITVPISDTSPMYAMQHSKYTGIKGGPEKPVAAITSVAGNKVLEAFSSTMGDEVEKLVYLPIPAIVEASPAGPNDTISICNQLLTPVIYQCAGLVAMTYKDELAKSLFEIAQSYLV